MKTIDQISLTPEQQRALGALRRRLVGSFGIRTMSLYGSFARGESDSESDIDVLIVTDHPLDRPTRHKITDIVWEINFEYGTNLSSLVLSRDAWENGMFAVLPIKEEILRDGVAI